MNHLAVLLRMLAAHFIADFFLQTRAGVEEKKKKRWKSKWLYLHSLVYALLVCASSMAWEEIAWLFIVFFVFHAAIDGLKAGRPERAGVFALDQLAHLVLLFAVWAALSPGRVGIVWAFLQTGLASPAVLLLIVGYLINLHPIGYLIGFLTEPLRRQLEEEQRQGLEKAGFWIGCLERFFVLSFILVGYAEGIAILAGAKSVFRYGEIRGPGKRRETEYILIGTLLSYAIAFATGVLIKSQF
jgi:hypothetical protein